MLLWEWDPHGRAGLCKRCDGALQCTPKASVIQTKRHTLPMPLLRFPLTGCAVLCPELCFDSTAKQAGCLKVAQRKGCRLVSSAVVQARRGLLGGYTPLLKTDVAHGLGGFYQQVSNSGVHDGKAFDWCRARQVHNMSSQKIACLESRNARHASKTRAQPQLPVTHTKKM